MNFLKIYYVVKKLLLNYHHDLVKDFFLNKKIKIFNKYT